MHLTSLVRSILYKATFGVPRKTIMTTPKNLQQLMDDLKTNPYFDKYAEKLAKKQNEDVTEFKKLLENVDEKKQKTNTAAAEKERQYSKLLKPKENVSGPAQLKHESLEKIMKMELIKDKSVDIIKDIWRQYHLGKEHCIAATIPASDFDKLSENSRKYPTFLFALPRSQGYEFMMCQFAQNTVHFTPLLYYQVHKENAPECLTITHYDDLKNEKGLVLMRGEYDKNIIDAKEALCLANQLQMYYIQEEPDKKLLLEIFTNKPDEFKHTDLIKQIENLSLS